MELTEHLKNKRQNNGYSELLESQVMEQEGSISFCPPYYLLKKLDKCATFL